MDFIDLAECKHEATEYQIIPPTTRWGYIDGKAWLGLVCLDCGLVMEHVKDIITPFFGNSDQRTTYVN